MKLPRASVTRKACSVKNKNGFTLLETILVVSLMMILAAIGYVVSISYLQMQNILAAPRVLRSEIEAVQLESYIQTDDSAHGLAIVGNTIVSFEGDSYATRDPDHDSQVELPSIASVSGDAEILFVKGSFLPQSAYLVTLSFEEQIFDVSISEYGFIEITQRPI